MTSDEMYGFIGFLLRLETLNIQKQTDCIILIHFLYIFSILSLYTNNEIFRSTNPRIRRERKFIFVYLYCTTSKENKENIDKSIKLVQLQ